MALKKLLAIETSGKICSVALCSFESREPSEAQSFLAAALTDNLLAECVSDDFEVIAEYNINIGNKHDKFCAELCHRILQDNDVAAGDLAGVAVSIGPGSFTGLRIGLAVAKGLCFGSPEEAIPLMAVPTLNAIALNGLTWLSDKNFPLQQRKSEKQNLFFETITQRLLAIIHSHSNLYYYQLFSTAGVPMSDIGFSDMASIAAQFADEPVYIGTNSKIFINFGYYFPSLFCLTAVTIGKLGAIQFARKQFANSADIQPHYVQAFVPR